MAANYQLAFEERTSWIQTENIWSSQQHRNNLWSPAARKPVMSELNSKPQFRQLYHKEWAARRHEMEKIFLDSPKKSCGTGFFLPRTVPLAGDFQLTNKSDIRRSSENWNNNNVTGNKKSQGSAANKTSSSSHYIYLPKEWTY